MSIAFNSCKNCLGFFRADGEEFPDGAREFARQCTCNKSERKRDPYVNASFNEDAGIWDSFAYGHALCQACEEDSRNVWTEHTCGR